MTSITTKSLRKKINRKNGIRRGCSSHFSCRDGRVSQSNASLFTEISKIDSHNICIIISSSYHLSLWCLSVCQSSVICFSFVYIWATRCDVRDIYSTAQRIMDQNGQKNACCPAYCKIKLDVVEHPGTSGILHFTYYVLGHTKSFKDQSKGLTL